MQQAQSQQSISRNEDKIRELETLLQKLGDENSLLRLELEEKKAHQKPLFDDLPLFSVVEEQAKQKESVVEKELKALDIDALSPREALDILYRLKGELK